MLERAVTVLVSALVLAALGYTALVYSIPKELEYREAMTREAMKLISSGEPWAPNEPDERPSAGTIAPAPRAD